MGINLASAESNVLDSGKYKSLLFNLKHLNFPFEDACSSALLLSGSSSKALMLEKGKLQGL